MRFFTYFLRNVSRSKFQFSMVIAGLALGMAVSMLIYVYVREERSFDAFHVDVDYLYRVNSILTMEGKTDRTAKASLNTGEALMEFYPEVESHTQVLNISKQTIRIDDDIYANDAVVYADSNFFSFFSFPLLFGDASTALDGPGKAVVSSSIAVNYFGSAEGAFEKTIEINKADFKISAVYDDRVGQTHLPYNIYLSLATLPADFLAQRSREYMWLTTYNYIKLNEGVSGDAFADKISLFQEKILTPYVKNNEVNGSITFEVEPVRNIHLNNTLRFDFKGSVNPAYLRIFSAVGFLTLLIALINYVNLTTANVSRRVREVGIKKFLGATRLRLFIQFVGETLLTSAIGFILAVIIVFLSLNELNRITGTNYDFWTVLDKEVLVTSVLFVFIFGILGSLYPAFLLSSLQPLNAIKAYKKHQWISWVERVINPASVRKGLVTAQFSISIFLIIGTLIIYQQFRFMSSKQLGFDQHQVMVVDIPNDTAVSNHIDVYKNSLLQIAGVKAVSCASSVPGSDHGALTMNVSQTGGSEIKVLNTYNVDEEFAEALSIKLSSGRFFSKDHATDPQQAFVINEAAAKFLGWEEPLGKKVQSPFGQDGEVVGVVKDFNYKSLHANIEPLIFMYYPVSQGYALVKISTEDLLGTVEKINATWRQMDPDHPYEYFFLDEQFQLQYIKEQRLISIFLYFSGFAILISCLGLIGLAVFTNESRVKEIGIRKTLGASNRDIVALLSKTFLIPILLSNVVAWTVSFTMVDDWLNQFAYKMDLTIVPFVLGAAIAFIIAALTVGYFSAVAARQDIVSSLRYE